MPYGKAPLRPNFLSKKGRRNRTINLLNMATLLFNAAAADKDPEIGWGDTLETLQSTLKRMNYFFFVDPSVIESLLWSSNMLDEKGKFWDPLGRSFDEFVKSVVIKGVFNKDFNYVDWNDERRGEVRTDKQGPGDTDDNSGPDGDEVE